MKQGRRLGWPISVWLGCVLIVSGGGATLRAGGGPENVLLVVNSQSDASLTLANHYIALRRIPSINVLCLPWDPTRRATDVDTFRRRILAPILSIIEQRGLARQIDYIVYSADFPTRIDLAADVQRELTALAAALGGVDKPVGLERLAGLWPVLQTPHGSLTGLTQLWRLVVAGKVGIYTDLRISAYMQRAKSSGGRIPSAAFRVAMPREPLEADLPADATSAGPDPFAPVFLSAMLGVVQREGCPGNTVEEMVDYLHRSASADGTRPDGTIYFVHNSDVRSRCRDRAFRAVAERIEAEGVKVEIVHGVLPRGRSDVQGVMTGATRFDWRLSGSTIRPGAFCDHLTSFGGVLEGPTSQTPLTEFLRHGAAGACGTVCEPFALQEKFPFAAFHLHYVRGCSLGEAFGQSVFCPYQILLVGDPLCQPWARPGRVRLEGVTAGNTVQGKMRIRTSVETADDTRVTSLMVLVDGLLLHRIPATEGAVNLDTRDLPDGYHEIQVVAVNDDPIASQARAILPIVTDNHPRGISCRFEPGAPYTPPRVHVESPGASKIVLLQHMRPIGEPVKGESGVISIESARLGRGPVWLRAVAFDAQAERPASSGILSVPFRLPEDWGDAGAR